MANFTVDAERIGTSKRQSAGPANAAGLSSSMIARTAAGSRWRLPPGLFQKRPFRRERPSPKPDGEQDLVAPDVYDALSDDGPFRRLSAAEAQRQVIFACFYYFAVACAVLAMIIWH